MRFACALIPLCVLLSCSGNNTEKTVTAKQADGVFNKDNLHDQIIQSGSGWGFNIWKDGKVYIHQPIMPNICGLQPFPSRASAEKVALYVIQKLRTGNYRFLMEKSDVDSLVKTQKFIKTSFNKISVIRNDPAPQKIQTAQPIYALDLKQLPTPPVKLKWRRIGTVPFGKRYGAMSFTIGDNIYIAGGESKDLFAMDLWSYNASQNYWTRLADIPQGRTIGGVSFSISSMGYLGLGGQRDLAALSYKNDFYQYNPEMNLWKHIKSFPGKPRADASVLVIDSNAYVGLGNDNHYASDMYSYNPHINSWRRVSDFKGGPVSAALGISTGDRGFIICGDNATHNKKFMYEYDPKRDQWLRRKDFPGSARYFVAGYPLDYKHILAGAGYTEGGEVKFRDFYLNDVTTGEWKRMPNYPTKSGVGRVVGGNLSGKIFLGSGTNNINVLNDWNVFEYYFNVRENPGVYNETISYPLKYDGRWELFQECDRENCYAGIEIRTNEQLGNFHYTSKLAERVRRIESGSKKLLVSPRAFFIRTEKQPQRPVYLRLFFTTNELIALLDAYNKNFTSIKSLNDLQILQVGQVQPEAAVSNDKIHIDNYITVKPQFYNYDSKRNVIVAEFPVSKLYSAFYLALAQ